jgi:hypothetical protein
VHLDQHLAPLISRLQDNLADDSPQNSTDILSDFVVRAQCLLDLRNLAIQQLLDGYGLERDGAAGTAFLSSSTFWLSGEISAWRNRTENSINCRPICSSFFRARTGFD